jgi:enoyl-CoA hydratase/carnithine racemase
MKLSSLSAEKSQFPDIILSYHKSIVIIKMNHGRTNALDKEFITQLYRCLFLLFKDNSVKVVVLSSNLRFAFCSGLDLVEALKYPQQDKVSNYLVRLSQLFMALANLIFNSPKPVVAAVGGVTIGLGVQIASLCDFRICSELAWFNIPEMAVGGVYPTIPLYQQIGFKNANKMVLFGEKIDAENAIDIGLIDKIVKHGMAEQESINFAQKLLSIDDFSFNLQRKLYRSGLNKLMKEEQRELIKYLRKAVNRNSVMNRLSKLRDTGNIVELARNAD